MFNDATSLSKVETHKNIINKALGDGGRQREKCRGRIHTRTSPSLHFFVFILSIFSLEYLNCNEYTTYFIYFRYKYIHKSWIMFEHTKKKRSQKKAGAYAVGRHYTERKQDNRADNLAKHNFYRLLPTRS